jgi:hypothetical protein
MHYNQSTNQSSNQSINQSTSQLFAAVSDHLKAMVIPEDSAIQRRRARKAEQAAAAAAEQARKYGICVLPFRMALLFSGRCCYNNNNNILYYPTRGNCTKSPLVEHLCLPWDSNLRPFGLQDSALDK